MPPHDALFSDENFDFYWKREAENIISRMTLSQDAAEVNELALEAQRLLQKAMAAGGPEYKSKYVYYAMGVACFKRREYEDAIRWHQKAIQIDAEFVPALLCLAEALQTQRNWGEAIGTYDQAFKHFVSYYARAGSETARKSSSFIACAFFTYYPGLTLPCNIFMIF